MQLKLAELTATEIERYTYIKSFQNNRLQETYDDFLQQPEWHGVCQFFFGRIYNTDDTQARDDGLARLHQRVQRVIGGEVVICMGSIIELQQLTIKLDLQLLANLSQLQAPRKFRTETYEQAYAAGANYAARCLQIDLIAKSLRLGFDLFQRFGIGLALGSLHAFQRLRGDAAVSGFLMEAYEIMSRLKQVEPLAVAIEQREMTRLDRIFSNVSNGRNI